MFELKKLNVHRIVATEEERDKLLRDGFELIDDSEQPAKTVDQMTVAELKAYAVENGIDLTGADKKPDILAKIKEAEGGSQ